MIKCPRCQQEVSDAEMIQPIGELEDVHRSCPAEQYSDEDLRVMTEASGLSIEEIFS